MGKKADVSSPLLEQLEELWVVQKVELCHWWEKGDEKMYVFYVCICILILILRTEL